MIELLWIAVPSHWKSFDLYLTALGRSSSEMTIVSGGMNRVRPSGLATLYMKFADLMPPAPGMDCVMTFSAPVYGARYWARIWEYLP